MGTKGKAVVEKRLNRSRDALVGGVCAGVADYFNIDPLIVRILVVVLIVATGGLFSLVYLGLWLLVPLAPDPSRPFDVEPEEVHSETYGSVEWDARRCRDGQGSSSGPCAGGWSGAASGGYPGTGHVPPEPPAGAQWRAGSVAPPPAWVPPSWQAPPVSPMPPAASGQAADPATPDGRSAGVKAALWIGTLLLFFGVLALLTSFIEDMAWWRFWPLIFMIVGIVRMVVPGEEGHRMAQFVGGLMVFFLGATLLSMSVGIVSWRTILPMLQHLWPLLLITAGLLILGSALKAPLWTLAGGVCFAAFCIVGIGWLSIPGPVDALMLSTPFGWQYQFVIR